jgi:hypothetical protein
MTAVRMSFSTSRFHYMRRAASAARPGAAIDGSRMTAAPAVLRAGMAADSPAAGIVRIVREAETSISAAIPQGYKA